MYISYNGWDASHDAALKLHQDAQKTRTATYHFTFHDATDLPSSLTKYARYYTNARFVLLDRPEDSDRGHLSPFTYETDLYRQLLQELNPELLRAERTELLLYGLVCASVLRFVPDGSLEETKCRTHSSEVEDLFLEHYRSAPSPARTVVHTNIDTWHVN